MNSRTSRRIVCFLLPLVLLFALPCSGGQKPNPYLSAPVYGLTHFDPGQTDTIPYPVNRGTFRIDLAKQLQVPGGPVNIQNLAAAQKGYMWAISTNRVAYVDTRNGAWHAVAAIDLPGVSHQSESLLKVLLAPPYTSIEQVEKLAKEKLGPQPQNVTASGLYTVADSDNTVYVNAGTTICAIGLKVQSNPATGLEVKRMLDTTKFFVPMALPGYPAAVRLIGMNMTYDGHLIIGAFNGIAVVDRLFAKPAVVYTIEAGQLISNSFSVDENNGIYVASGSIQPRRDGILHKLVWTGKQISADEKDGSWLAFYDGGNWPPAVKAGTGTGSTPTLMGFEPDKDRLVILTDGEDRMKIVAFWRDNIPSNFKQKPGTKSRRIADQMPITAGLPKDAPWIQSEQSVVSNGWGAFVVNNVIPAGHPDKIIDVLAIGPVTAPPRGMERVEWDPQKHAWRSVWRRSDVASTSMVPVASAPSGIVFVNGYSKKDGWEVTGLDWKTGKTVHRTIFGQNNLGNGAYAILQFMENGDLLFNSVGGPFRIPLREK